MEVYQNTSIGNHTKIVMLSVCIEVRTKRNGDAVPPAIPPVSIAAYKGKYISLFAPTSTYRLSHVCMILSHKLCILFGDALQEPEHLLPQPLFRGVYRGVYHCIGPSIALFWELRWISLWPKLTDSAEID